MTVKELLTRMDSRELTEWQAYFIILGDEQRDREMIASAESGAETRRWSR